MLCVAAFETTRPSRMSSWQAHLLQGGYIATSNDTEGAVHQGESSLPCSPGSEEVAFVGFITVVKPYRGSSSNDAFAIVNGDTFVGSVLLKEKVRVGDQLCGTKVPNADAKRSSNPWRAVTVDAVRPVPTSAATKRMPTAPAPTPGPARCQDMGVQQARARGEAGPVLNARSPLSSVRCRYFAKSGCCKSGDTCRFLHELPGGIEAARRRIGSTVSEERRRDESDGRLYTRAEFVAEYNGTAEWERAAPVLERAEAATAAKPPPRYDGVLKLRNDRFAVVSASKGYEVYVPEWVLLASGEALRQGDFVEGEMAPSNRRQTGAGRCPWTATSISAACVARTLAGPELGAPPSDGPLVVATSVPTSVPSSAPAADAGALAGAELRSTGVATSREDKVSFLVADLQLDPSLPWLEVIRAVEARTGLHPEGSLGGQIDFLYGELA